MKRSIHQPVIDRAWQTPVQIDGVYTHDFARFSANLYHCLPALPLERHEALFSEACAHQALAVAEQACAEQTNRLLAQPVFPELVRTPGIIATYHFGSYRLIGKWLAMHRIPFALVLASSVYRMQGPVFQEIIRKSAGEDTRFTLIDAENRLSLIHMKRALDSGHHLLVYLDGNTGAGSGKHACEVPFLEGRLRVRAGTAYLAAMTRSPIYPIANRRNDSYQNRFEMASPIHVAAKRSMRDLAITDTMVELYGWLAGMVRDSPAQWEAWFYLHHGLVLRGADLSDDGGHCTSWITFRHSQNGYVYRLNRRTFLCTPIYAG